MARVTDSAPLDAGVTFPPLTLQGTGGAIVLPTPGRWTVVVIYRGEF